MGLHYILKLKEEKYLLKVIQESFNYTYDYLNFVEMDIKGSESDKATESLVVDDECSSVVAGKMLEVLIWENHQFVP